MSLHKVVLTDRWGKPAECNLHSFPTVCPICHTAVHPVFIAGSCQAHSADKPQVVFRCTAQDCARLFIADYSRAPDGALNFTKAEPIYPKKAQLPDVVAKLSPVFVEVYNQALAAETGNLSQLTGIGLRKAIEFLVKDFSSHLHPEEKEAIERSHLASCIDTFISDDRIKTCAKLATWLGNDETHYVRKWLDKDISDLKRLIRLTINWIENHLLTEEYKNDMMPNAGSALTTAGKSSPFTTDNQQKKANE